MRRSHTLAPTQLAPVASKSRGGMSSAAATTLEVARKGEVIDYRDDRLFTIAPLLIHQDGCKIHTNNNKDEPDRRELRAITTHAVSGARSEPTTQKTIRTVRPPSRMTPERDRCRSGSTTTTIAIDVT